MKLRIQDRCLRLRLEEEEAAALLVTGCLARSLRLSPPPGPDLQYALEIAERPDSPAVHITGRGIRVVIPRQEAERLLADPTEGFHHEFTGGGGTALDVHVERDEGESCPAKATGRSCPLRSQS